MNKNTVRTIALLLGVAVLVIPSVGCITAADDVEGSVTPDKPYTTVSVGEIAQSLADRGPITVGLDPDSTTFYRGAFRPAGRQDPI
jgi:acid phosphatase class B